MSDSALGEIIDAVLGGSRGGLGGAVEGGLGGALGGMLGGGTGSALGGVLGGLAAGRSPQAGTSGPGGGMMLAMLLPLAMGWVQRNGCRPRPVPSERIGRAGGFVGLDRAERTPATARRTQGREARSTQWPNSSGCRRIKSLMV